MKKLRRWPHRRQADPTETDPLEVLRSLPTAEAQAFDRFLHQQADADKRFDDRQIVESAALPNGGFERYVGARVSQVASTGGGRRRRRLAPAE